MKKSILVLYVVCVSVTAFAQKSVDKIKASVRKSEIQAHMTFLASDEMRGRDTGSPEIAIAANYIMSQFSIAGLKMAPGMKSYFQEVRLTKSGVPKAIALRFDNETFSAMTDLLMASGKSVNYTGDFIFVGYGNEEDYKDVDVKGKVVITYTGSSEKSTPNEAFGKDSPAKHKTATGKGAAAVIELVTFVQIPWQAFTGYFGGGTVTLDTGDKEGDVPHLFMRKSTSAAIDNLLKNKKVTGSLSIEKPSDKILLEKNVIGVIEGTDSKLKNEYIALTAHYDHIGITKPVAGDSINNGARDNALGTTAIIEAANYFAKNPTKRSLLIMAYCGEEKGLLGSQWYVNHPVIPLSQTVYNLDCDGAGYNDKTVATLIDLNRTTADEPLKKSTEAFGLKLTGDPVPAENLYERSDNFSFAMKGVPAVDFSTGVTAFDAELLKYYHRPADEVGSLDFDYLEKFIRAYVYASSMIGDLPVKPAWKAGDKFEEAGKQLYGGGK